MKKQMTVTIIAFSVLLVAAMPTILAFDTYINNSNIFVNGSVGIGTSSPDTTLVVNPNSNSHHGITIANSNSGNTAQAMLSLLPNTANSTRIADSGQIGWNIITRGSNYNDAAQRNDLHFEYYNGSDWINTMHFDFNGRVGIGTSNPSHKLNIVGSTNITGNLISKTIHEVSSQGLVFSSNFNNGSIEGSTVLDSSTYNNHGTIDGTVHTSEGGFNGGGAYVFDGTNDHIDIPYDASLKVNDLTVMAWIKPNVIGGWRWIMGYPFNCTAYTGGLMEYGFWLSPSGQIQSRIDGDVKGNFGNLTAGAWAHVVITSDSSATNYYINGEFVDDGTGDGSITYNNNCGFLIGANVDREYFNGTIDDPRIYDRVLSLDEIESIYYQKAEMGDSYLSQKDVYVDSDGSIGIGTTSPGNPLTISAAPITALINYGQLHITTPNDNQDVFLSMRTTQGNNRTWLVGAGSGSGDENFRIYDGTDGTDRLNIDEDGDVGIGTTNPGNHTLYVNHDLTHNVGGIFVTGFGTGQGWGIITQASTAADNEIMSFVDNAGTQIGSIDEVGSNVAYRTSSDKRLKTNIRDTKYGLDALMNIQVRDYEWINDGTTSTGFVAQELYKAYPGAVTIGDDGEVIEHVWKIDYSKVTPILTKAIQEQQSQIEELKTENNALKEIICRRLGETC